ncbi:SRPBCC family protein [Flavitalea flava]
MKTSDFNITLLIDKSPEEAFKAITNIRGWWSEEIEGDTDNLNGEFIYHYKDIHFCKMKLIELVPGRKAIWLVQDNYFKFTKDKSEWKGTKLVFTITPKHNQTEISFTHEGLVPHYECYEICTTSWANYISSSLQSLITTGKGEPNSKENDKFNAELVEKWKLEQPLLAG